MLPGLALVATLVAGCPDWHEAVVGHYLGQVESDGPKAVDTMLTLTAKGTLVGRYVLHERTRDVYGTLAFVADEGCDVALFRWTDLYGTGIARLHFHPRRHCFDGAWGITTLNPALIWRSCAQGAVTS